MNKSKKSGATAHFSLKTLAFLLKASRQKDPRWLDRNRAEYESSVLDPLKNLAAHLKAELASSAPSYHFPQKGIGRLRRSADHVRDARSKGKGLFKDWMSYSASRPTGSRFDHNPNLFFLINPNDRKDSVLSAGGLYIPSSRQIRAVREAIAKDASAFDRLFSNKEFARSFPGGFSGEKTSKRPPRGFDPQHPRCEWLRLQAFYVWRSYSKREFISRGFGDLLARDWKQILRLNALLEKALQASTVQNVLPRLARESEKETEDRLMDRIEGIDRVRHEMDF